MELIAARKQKEWGWPAIANFVLGGMGAGYYLLSLLETLLVRGLQGTSQPDLYKLIAPLIVAAGFLALTIEAGRPLRGVYLLSRLNLSWMSRETLAGVIFVGAALLERSFSSPPLLLLSALSASALLLSQGFVLMRACAVTAWDVPFLPWVVISSGLAGGGGLMLLTWPATSMTSRLTGFLPMVFGIVDLAVWRRYLSRSGPPCFQRAIESLRRPASRLIITGLGRLVPVLLLTATFLPGLPEGIRPAVFLLAGLALVTGGALQKKVLLRNAAYLRGIGVRLRGEGAEALSGCNTQPKGPNK